MLSYLLLGAVLICIGIAGILSRKNTLTIVFALEILFSGINLTFATFSSFQGTVEGILFTFFIMAITACETVLLITFIFLYHKLTKTTHIDQMNYLQG